ncbi:MAG TPA: acyltransferase, partial [Ktedonobacterales bacterium]|nr:acyltransferase [Ktedonobacterales bacterium]
MSVSPQEDERIEQQNERQTQLRVDERAPTQDVRQGIGQDARQDVGQNAREQRDHEKPQAPRHDIDAAKRQLFGVLRWLKPLNASSHEIRVLDGVRAVAALSIVVFHSLLSHKFEYTPLSHFLDNTWYYFSTGVQLFFVLSGFLLFMPYAR